MKRDIVAKAAALIARSDAVRARIKELRSGDCAYITCDIRKSDKTSSKSGFDGDEEMKEVLITALAHRLDKIEAEIMDLGVVD